MFMYRFIQKRTNGFLDQYMREGIGDGYMGLHGNRSAYHTKYVYLPFQCKFSVYINCFSLLVKLLFLDQYRISANGFFVGSISTSMLACDA